MKKQLDNIHPLEDNFARWYQDVVVKGNLIDYGNTKGSMIFKPISFGIWENIQKELNSQFKEIGVENVYLPLLIPQSYIEKEKDHIKGFAPELATVTRVGDKELEEPYVIRPTSEVLFGELFAKMTHSYNDLPIKYNQWSNVLRWEKTTNPFLRNREFLWQEGHTVHNNQTEAKNMAKEMIELYSKFARDYLAVPTIMGEKTENEKFAGAVTTYTIEAMMKDGKALQAGTTHYLGQNFAKAFNISFKNKDNKPELAYQTSWGVSTRLIGGLIMTHGDNRGIIIPPKIAPNQIDIIELFADKNENVSIISKDLKRILGKEFKVRLDSSDKGPGFKAGKSEIEGTPLRIEVGPRDLEKDEVTFVRRDTLEKMQVSVKDIDSNTKTILDKAKEILDSIQRDLLLDAEKRLKENIVSATSYDEMKALLNKRKFVIVPFAGGKEEEKKIKEETTATSRCIPFESFIPFEFKNKELQCVITNKKTNRFVIFAKAY